MVTYNLTKSQKGISSGQKFVFNDSGNTAELEKRVSNIENKLNNGALTPHITSFK